MAQLKEQNKTPEKELCGEERQPIRCTVQNTSNMDFTEMVEYGRKMEEEMKAVQNEMKRNVQGTNSDGKEIGTQINGLEQKEEINIQLQQNEETRIQEKRKSKKWKTYLKT